MIIEANNKTMETLSQRMEENTNKSIESLNRNMESLNKKLDDYCNSLKEAKEEIRIDNKPETEEVPEDKNTEQVSPKTEDNGEKKTQIIKNCLLYTSRCV